MIAPVAQCCVRHALTFAGLRSNLSNPKRMRGLSLRWCDDLGHFNILGRAHKRSLAMWRQGQFGRGSRIMAVSLLSRVVCRIGSLVAAYADQGR